MYFATASEMEHLDDLAVEHGLEIRQMMELAGWHILQVFQEEQVSRDQRIVVVVGKGNKGGDGLAAARHLANYGYHASVVLSREDLKPDPLHHLKLVQEMNLDVVNFAEEPEDAANVIQSADVIIDSLIGYHLDGAPRGAIAELIVLVNSADARIISYDVPSGVHPTTGECYEPCITADATLTLAMPKQLFQTTSGKEKSGAVYLADIGIPAYLYNEIHAESRPDFGETGIMKSV